MNRVFFLGNGFDLNLGLKTKYADFYNYYLSLPHSGDKAVREFKKNIAGDMETWAELELQLGVYTSALDAPDQLDSIRFDVMEKLLNYLESEEERADLSSLGNQKLIDDLLHAEDYISQIYIEEIRTMKSYSTPAQREVRLFTFNYTKSLEKILGKVGLNNDIKSRNGRSATVRAIEHIHGSTTERAILGVDNIDQIANENFRIESDVVEGIVKPIHNRELGHTRDRYCTGSLANANLIFIFGSSIGATDKSWWVEVARSVGPECRLVIFHRPPSSYAPAESIKEVRERRIVKQGFLAHSDLTDAEKETAMDYIYVGVHTNIFRLKSSV